MLSGGVGCPFIVDAVAFVFAIRIIGKIIGRAFIANAAPFLHNSFTLLNSIKIPPFVFMKLF